MNAPIDIGLPVVRAPVLPPLYLRNGNPLVILAAMRAVARKADWSLAKWDEVSASFKSCFSPDALPEEHEKGMDVVRSHFEVTTAPGFSSDVRQWDHRIHEVPD